MNRKETLNQNCKGSDEAVYHQPLPVAMRVILVFGAGITLLAPYELLIKPGIPVFQLGMIPFWVIAGGACLVGLVFLAAAILGYAKTVSFDCTRRQMILRADGIIRITRVWSYPFERLGVPAVRADSSSDGPTVYRLEIPIAAVLSKLPHSTPRIRQRPKRSVSGRSSSADSGGTCAAQGQPAIYRAPFRAEVIPQSRYVRCRSPRSV